MMSPSNALLARYLAGECSADEVRAIIEWANEDAAHQVLLDQFQTVWQARRVPPSWDVSGMWSAVQRSMRTKQRVPVRESLFLEGREQSRTRWFLRGAAAVAATVLLVAGIKVIPVHQADQSATASMPMREYATARGQRAKLQLPDGTRLVLAPESRIRYPATFGRTAREVVLDGEALFDVVHDAARPFLVRAKYAVARDIGTRFDVRAYAEDSTVAVAVAEGAVALGAGDTSPAAAAQGVVLGVGELGTLGHAGQVTTTRGPLTADYLAWADGRLTFTDVPLGEVAARIGRWYGVDVQLASPGLAGRRVTATFNGESAIDALRFVASFLNLTVVQVGDRYTLQAK